MKYLIACLLAFSSFLGAKQSSVISPKEYRPPVLSTTAIIEIYDKPEGNLQGIVLIDRGKEPYGKALPGGKVEYGESVEYAVRREMKEETNLDIYELRQFHVYSEPNRDPRWHTVEVTHLAKAYARPRPGDDAAQTYIVPLDKIPWDEFAFDHAQILKDYLSYREGNQQIQMVNP